MKKIINFLLILILGISLFGCGGDKKQEGVITVWWPGGSEAESAAIYRAKELYEDLHPEITIKIIPQSTTNFYMNYMLALEGLDYPDVAYVDHVYVQQLMYQGAIADLSALDFDELQSTFIDSLWKPNTYENKLYALPFSSNVLATVYNKTLLSAVYEREFTEADLPKSYDELKVVAQKILDYNASNNLTGDDAYIPITIPAGNGNESMAAMAFLSYAARENGQIMSDDLKTMTINSAACIQAATKIQELGSLNYTPSTFSEGKFEAGKVAFIEMGSWKITDYERIAEFKSIEFGYAPIMPLVKEGSNPSALGLYSLVVTKKSINQVIASEFIKFIATNDELQLLHNRAQNLMPTTKTAINDSFYTGDIWSVYTNQLNANIARPGSPEWPEIERQIANFVTSLITGTRTPDYLNSLNYGLQAALDDIYG